MAIPGEFSWREIMTQGESWRSALDATLAQREELLAALHTAQPELLVFIGCGSTHCLAQFAAPFFQRATGMLCRAAPSSELLLQTETVVPPGRRALIVALSRSGETSETVMAVEKMRARGSQAITISCYDQTPLSAASSRTVNIPGGREESYAQTRSFAGMLVAAQGLAALASHNEELLAELKQLPGLAQGIVGRAAETAVRIGPDESVQRITYLGSGPLIGLAAEATVKMKEMSLSNAEAYHFMEFRHGPMALIDAQHLIVGLLSDAMWDYEVAVLRELQRGGARILAIANQDRGLSAEFGDVFALQAPLQEPARGVLYMPLLQLLAYHRSLARGLNPDRPRNVVMAIRLDGTGVASV